MLKMNKFQKIMKYQHDIKKNKEIDMQVEGLIVEFKKTASDYQKKIYLILKDIIELRGKQISGYSVSNLSKEKGIDMTPHQLSYLFGYRYISDFTMGKIDEGKLKTSTALFIVRQDKRFREAMHQNKAVKIYLDGKLKTTEIARISSDIIFDTVNIDEEVSIANKQLIRMGFQMQEHAKTLRCKIKLFSDKKSMGMIDKKSKEIKIMAEQLGHIIVKTKIIDKIVEDYNANS